MYIKNAFFSYEVNLFWESMNHIQWEKSPKIFKNRSGQAGRGVKKNWKSSQVWKLRQIPDFLTVNSREGVGGSVVKKKRVKFVLSHI